MKIASAPKSRVQLKSKGCQWTLFVDDQPVISSHDRRWLQRFAANLRKILATDSTP